MPDPGALTNILRSQIMLQSLCRVFKNLFMAIFIFGALIAPRASSDRTAMNSIYAEGLGPGLAYSIDYERLVINDLGVRVGFGYTSFTATAGSSSSGVSFYAYPITASYIGISSGSHCLEAGGGATIVYATGAASNLGLKATGSGTFTLGNVLLGYRIHPVHGGFQFRTGFAGLFGSGLGATVEHPTAWGFLPWFYISLGGCF
jgi:hypothetical protein